MTSDPIGDIGDIDDVQGRQLIDSDGEPLGQISEIFLDEATGRPAWAAVDAPGGGDDLVLAPLAHSTRDGDAVRVAVTRERVETSPSTSGLTERFSADHMDRVRAHYADQPADLDTGHQHATGVSGELPSSMIRSEEALVVDHERVPRERVRLVKRIVTETVTQTVEVRREELHLERVAITGSGDGDYVETPTSAGTVGDETAFGTGAGASEGIASERTGFSGTTGSGAAPTGRRGAAAGGGTGLSALRARASSLAGKAGERFGGAPGFGEAFNPQTLDLTLYEEEVVVTKRVVPRERVRIHREVVTEQQTISDELRKEQIEVEHIGLDQQTRAEGGDYRADTAR